MLLHVIEGPGSLASRFLKEATSAIAAGLCAEVMLLARSRSDLRSAEEPRPGVSIVRVGRWTDGLPRCKALTPLRMWESRRSFVRAGLACKARLVHCHSLSPLRACLRLGRLIGAPVIYDAHELETERNGLTGPLRILDKWTERRLIRRAAAVLVVNDSIADWYAREYGIERPVVVRNVPLRPEGPPPGRSPILRATFGIPEGELIFLYAGGLFRGRRVEQFLRVFLRVSEDRHLVFMGYGELEGMVRAAAAMRRNVHFLPAVPPAEVLRYTAGADVGLVGIENVCLSYYYSLPNKLFEYLLAGVPAVGGDWPEIRRVIESDGCGWVVGETDEDWLRFLNGVSGGEIQTRREGALRARLRYSWQREEAALLRAYEKVLGLPSGSRC